MSTAPSPIRIKSVRFERLRSFGQFENMRVGVECEVPEGTDPKEVLASAQIFVDMELSEKIFKPQVDEWEKRLQGMQQKVWDEQQRLFEVERKLNKAQGQLELQETGDAEQP
jgi:hypothetical protein